MQNIGKWSFIIGLVAAALIAAMATQGGGIPVWAVLALIVLGLVVGLLNITDDEASAYLIAAIAFMVSLKVLGDMFGNVPVGLPFLGPFFVMITVFVAPSAVVVALKVMFDKAKDK
tara:strand:- start:277 stop:624 length:348 start_codon:yes stop_codon:yes gene_type:complete